MADSGGVSGPLERWSPTLWFGSGAIGIVYASLFGMEVFMGTYPAIGYTLRTESVSTEHAESAPTEVSYE